MKPMLRYIISLTVVFLSFAQINAQEVKKDSVEIKTQRYGVRVGADLYKLTRSFYDENYKGLELVGDYRLTKNYYIAGELGNEEITVDDTRLNFTTSGTYFKVGFDYNMYENWLDMENMVYVGMRYGVSSFSQRLNTYKIYNPTPHFEPSVNLPSGEEFKGLSASWAEVVIGMKAEVINNIYVGFAVNLKYLVTNKVPETFDNLYIPGFNRTYDGNFGIGFNYTVSYFIPLYKKKYTVDIKK